MRLISDRAGNWANGLTVAMLGVVVVWSGLSEAKESSRRAGDMKQAVPAPPPVPPAKDATVSAPSAAGAQQQPEAQEAAAKAKTEAEAKEGAEAKGEAQPPPSDAQAQTQAPPPNVWSEEEIATAKAHCDKVLRGVEAVLEFTDPIKEGECGAPAPVRLISVGRDPEVVMSPPVMVTCEVVAKVADWIKDDVQDLARVHLGAPIVRVETMSSYSCRNAYGRKKTRLSEHGRANAIDIGSFVTSSGTKVNLLADWGMTARDVAAMIAAAKAEAEKAAAREAAAKKLAGTDKAKSPGAGRSEAKPLEVARASLTPPPLSLTAKSPVIADTIPGRKTAKSDVQETAPAPVRKRGDKAATGSELVVASHLGGPDANPLAAAKPAPDDRLSQFLKAAHSSACRRFGTVLGPEANEAHRNHFHLDMAERKRSNYCE